MKKENPEESVQNPLVSLLALAFSPYPPACQFYPSSLKVSH